MRPSELPDHYFTSVRERDIERFIALFSEDAVMIMPDGREVSGARAIREMEMAVFASSPPVPTPLAVIADQNSVAVEVEVRLPNGQLMRVANFFRLDAQGRIKRLSVYRKTA